MLQTFIIALREGVEAALVVAIAIAYLKKIDRRDLLSSVYRAFVAAVFASFLVAIPLALVNVNEDRYEGWLLVVSAVFVLSMVFWMNRHSKALKGQIETRLQQETRSDASRWGIFLFVFLMVFREGVETVLMLNGLRFDTSGIMALLGTVLGLGLAVLFGVTGVYLIQWQGGSENQFAILVALTSAAATSIAMIGLHTLRGVNPNAVVVHFSKQRPTTAPERRKIIGNIREIVDRNKPAHMMWAVVSA